MRSFWLMTLLLCASPAMVLAAEPSPEATYSVVDQQERWDISLGHHRARVHVEAAAPAVQVHISWRLELQGMDRHAVIVMDPAGRRVPNVVPTSATREAADFVFQAATTGVYCIYYLPFRPYLSWGRYAGDRAEYQSYRETADAAWRDANGLGADALKSGDWKRLPAARLIDFQARSEFDRFDPMEVIATAEETAALLANQPQAMLVFPEDRRFPIRMQNDLPLRWINRGPQAEFAGEAMRNEYYTFQLGIFAAKQPLTNLTVRFSGLRDAADHQISAAALTCFNTDGIDPYGKPLTKVVDVPADHVQAMWCGIDVAAEQAPGVYTGTATVRAEGTPPETVAISLTVTDRFAADRGDADLWRHARLRWLNSPIGLDEDAVVPPYTALTVQGARIACLGREVRLADGGLPANVTAGTHEVLSAPARLVVETAAGPIAFHAEPSTFSKTGPGRVQWQSRSTAADATLACEGAMEFDGYLHYSMTFSATAAADLQDVRLELPFREESAGYMMGAGLLGGARPKEHRWMWDGPFDSFWLGSPNAGMQCQLLGGAYHGPLLNLYHPAPPPTWGNQGRGGVVVRQEGAQVLATAFSGPRHLAAGEKITFEFALIVTPVKPLAPATHFKTRYWHIEPEPPPKSSLPDPTPEALAAGVNVVNVHQATR